MLINLKTRCLTVSLFILLATAATAQPQMIPVEALTTDTTTGWNYVTHSLSIAKNKVEILPADPANAKKALYNARFGTNMVVGAVVYKTGGILIDGGWIRILGSGNARLSRNLPEWNKGKTLNTYDAKPGYTLVADDVVGGFFALNNGALGPESDKIYYLAPDDLKWEPLHITYPEFIDFCFVGDMNLFYDGLRWATWQKDLPNVSSNQSFLISPHPWTREGKDPNKDTRKIVPVEEVYKLETGLLSKHK